MAEALLLNSDMEGKDCINRNDRVVPHELCDNCRQFCGEINGLEFVFGRDFEWFMRKEVGVCSEPQRLVHYESKAAITEGADEGCHLCAILLDRVQQPPNTELHAIFVQRKGIVFGTRLEIRYTTNEGYNGIPWSRDQGSDLPGWYERSTDRDRNSIDRDEASSSLDGDSADRGRMSYDDGDSSGRDAISSHQVDESTDRDGDLPNSDWNSRDSDNHSCNLSQVFDGNTNSLDADVGPTNPDWDPPDSDGDFHGPEDEDLNHPDWAPVAPNHLELRFVKEEKDLPPNLLDPNHSRWAKNASSESNFDLVRAWLKHCVEDHVKCNLQASSHRPRRLLDIATKDGPEIVKVVDGPDVDPKTPYLTLSYSWGGIEPFMLTTANYEACRSGIAIRKLPKTYRDAIFITRRLGLHYLWIDSMCMKQLDREEWAAEAGHMGSIFAGSLCTIAAHDAENCEEGCLYSRRPLQQNICLLEGSVESGLMVPMSCDPEEEDEASVNHLETRGWVYQEYALSPRTVFYGRNQIRWACRTCWHCETVHDEHQCNSRKRVRSKALLSELLDLTSVRAGNGSQGERDFLWRWGRLLANYSQTNLTKKSDRLIALAGLGQLLETRLDIQSSFGLWTDFLPLDLAWHAPGPGVRAIDRAPTWSWASVDGIYISNEAYVYACKSGEGEFDLQVEIVQKPDRSPFNSAKSLTEGSSRFSIKLKGSVTRGTWTKEDDTYWLQLPGASEPKLFHADCELSDSTCPEEVCCLLLAYVDCVYNSGPS